ncbi:helix-turn-helix domain-containing protein [Aquimarina sp. M1]|jgi:AraC-like DNA-binding protein|uniref:Helix-turn-helix transcriptional regulator n=3 Tax=Nonlabens TaxID=363408 RepID=A0ABS0A536_9FLAO|nr:AraC family transcriptional regulator [Nonlabens dokdonensis]AGC75854.1 putative regulatory protein [Nonlabens dokdonensis DSW-6]MBF4984498.1 helix-turn-helix transcriptional regulator [Nonlabens mediterrranea]PZX43537.1 AraC-like DNA-binding protein [Nonlabens dokdonensis]
MVKDFYIKNMVCDRCIKVLKSEIESQGIELKEIELGRVKLDIKNDDERYAFKEILSNNGFAIIDSAEDTLTEQVKIILIKMMENLPIQLSDKLSKHLSEKLHQDYSKISKVFSFTQGNTIEKYFIKLKIEKVKELIQTQEKNFTEISQLLDYSHINHLSRQFKTETGMSLTTYKKQQQNFRNSLDQIL